MAALKGLRSGDTFVVWKIDRMGRSLSHIVSTIQDLSKRGISLHVLTGQGAALEAQSDFLW